MARRVKADEEFARESFSRALTRFGNSEAAIWELGPDPPDFFLTLGAERYAVEVTRVVGQVEIGGRKESKRRSGAALLRFADDLERIAREQGILNGAYVLWLEPIADFKEVAPRAQAEILEYVARTREVPSAPKKLILDRGDVYWSVKKYHDRESYLATTQSGGGGGLLSEVLKDFPDLLRDAIESKVVKLARLSHQRILLLVDDYHFAGNSVWQEQLPGSLCRDFHTIARVFQEYECQILSSMNEDWQKGVCSEEPANPAAPADR